MQAFAIDSQPLFDFLADSLLKSYGFQAQTTHTGATVLTRSGNDSVVNTALFVLGPDHDACRQNINWVYKNLHPDSFVNVGFADRAGPPDDGTKPEFFIPTTCLRSAGLTQFGGNPVLFEELVFDEALQTRVAKRSGGGNAPRGHLSQSEMPRGHLFGSDRPLTKSSDAVWLWENLECEAWDLFTADLLLAGKRFLCPVGCLKIQAKDDAHRPELLLSTLQKLIET